MSEKPNLDDILDKFNWISRVQGILWGLKTYLPHRRSHKGRKVGHARIDGGTCEIHIDRRANTGGDAERCLAAAHIPIAGKRITGKEAIFIVAKRQAAWAELLLLRAGIALGPNHSMIDPQNVRYAAGKGAVPLWGKPPADGDAPTDPKPVSVRPTPTSATPSSVAKPPARKRQAKTKTSRQTVSRLRRTWWRIQDAL